jgi:hypothetical protein
MCRELDDAEVGDVRFENCGMARASAYALTFANHSDPTVAEQCQSATLRLSIYFRLLMAECRIV